MNDDLDDVFRHVGDDAPSHQLDVTATIRRGRALRRRRTVVRGIGTVATLAVLGGIGVVGVRTLAPRTDISQSIAGRPTPTPSSTGAPAPSTISPSTSPPSTAPGTVSAAEVAAFVYATTAELLAPYGTVNIDDGYRFANDAHFVGHFDLVDAHGSTMVAVVVSRGRDPEHRNDRRLPHPTSCADVEPQKTCQVLDDGSLLVTGTASGFSKDDPRYTGERTNSAQLYRSDKVMISLASSNGSGEKGVALRADPPLTTQQLAELVTNPIWDEAPVPE